jgi:predicted HTH domain antitoxin
MNIALPQELEKRLTEAEASLSLALGLYAYNRVSLGQGAAIAGMPTSAFLLELGKRRVPVHYELDDALADIAKVAKLKRR